MTIQIGDILKQLRRERGITQEEFAEIMGVSGQSVSRWELGVCYPDIELLPVIANYFGVTVDRLFANDALAREADRKRFLEMREEFALGSKERVDLAEVYCRRYPKDPFYAWCLANYSRYYLWSRPEPVEYETYMALLRGAAENLLDTRYRNGAIQCVIEVCGEEELDRWLDLCPYDSTFNRRGCLVARAAADQEGYIQQGLESVEKIAVQLDRRFPDAFGPERKAAFQREILAVLASFGDGKVPPDGWKLFHAYKQLVLSACLFGMGREDEGWQEFSAAMKTYEYVFGLDEEYLDLGGEMFANLKISKDWTLAIDGSGRKHELFAVERLSFYDAAFLHAFLTNPRWAWFDAVRDTPRYRTAVEWAAARC